VQHLHLSADELLTTTRSVRKRLDLEQPVDRDLILECIDMALQAPTGSNMQNWHWIVVTDDDTKARLAELYGAAFDPYIEAMTSAPQRPAGDPRGDRAEAVSASAAYLRAHLQEVPALVIPCAWGRLPDNATVEMQAGFWGSILPAVWSFMLALRERSLGSAWTTLHLRYEREAADLLGIPFDKVTQVGLFPVAYTIGTDFKPARRLPADQVVHWDRW
jgi:nitroreductase